MRARFFGPEASTARVTRAPRRASSTSFRTRRARHPRRRRRRAAVRRARARSSWSSTPPRSRRTTGRRASRTRTSRVNANGTLNLLQAARAHAPDATFIFTSTNKVYGDPPNRLPLVEHRRRGSSCPRTTAGTAASTRRCRSTARTHSLFGVSKAAADLLVQEYGRYFDMPTVCFRGGCLTGPAARGRAAARLPRLPDECTVTGEPYTIFGYGGKQVRDNIHAADVVRAFAAFHARPAAGGRLQPRRRAREQLLDARGDRRCASEIAGRELRLDALRRGPHRRPPLVDPRPRRLRGRLPGLAARRTASRTMLREIHDAERRALDGAAAR